MSKNFYEVVVEGNYHTIYGLFEGYMLGTGKSWHYYFSKKVNIKRDTLSDVLKQWVSLGNKIHHIIIEEELLNGIKNALANQGEKKDLGTAYIKSEKKIKGASFNFEFKAYAKKFADEIKAIISDLPEGISLMDYNPKEKVDKDAKGVELYSPEHEYEFQGKGKVKGTFPEIIDVWEKFEKHPLINPQAIEIEWA